MVMLTPTQTNQPSIYMGPRLDAMMTREKEHKSKPFIELPKMRDESAKS